MALRACIIETEPCIEAVTMPQLLNRVAKVSPTVSRRNRQYAVLIVGVGLAIVAASWLRPANNDAKAATLSSASPESGRQGGARNGLPLPQAVQELKAELARLDAAFVAVDERATAVLGTPESGHHRTVELPKDHASLVRYLKDCLSLVRSVESAFGELVISEQVDLGQRIPEAQKHVDRLERSSSAGLLVRRQVRAWIEKDLSAMEDLSEDWPAIRSAVEQLAWDAKRFDAGEATLAQVASAEQSVRESASARIRFPQSRLGMLCLETMAAAEQLERERETASVAAVTR
jgi:hypothetical protein